VKTLPINLITHFYNEEYLLPFWIEWHRNLNFKKVILIDYFSTDRSLEIIKQMAPKQWDVVQSRNENFSAAACDREVMDIERGLRGWEIALNATEFFMPTRRLYNRLGWFSTWFRGRGAYACPQAIVTGKDKEEYFPKNLSEFAVNFKYGLILEKTSCEETIGRDKPRYLHNNSDGAYMLGRHQTKLKKFKVDNLAFVAWVGFYPWNPKTIQRKMQIKNRIPQTDIDRHYGYQHMWSQEKITEQRIAFLDSSKNLLDESREFAEAYRYSMSQQRSI